MCWVLWGHTYSMASFLSMNLAYFKKVRKSPVYFMYLNRIQSYRFICWSSSRVNIKVRWLRLVSHLQHLLQQKINMLRNISIQTLKIASSLLRNLSHVLNEWKWISLLTMITLRGDLSWNTLYIILNSTQYYEARVVASLLYLRFFFLSFFFYNQCSWLIT